MCGIAGVVSSEYSSHARHAHVQGMVRSIAHRGPDDEGIWCDDESGAALAHRRLSIVDLSPRGHQPMFSHDGRYAIVFNGEIYNFQSVREKLDRERTRDWRSDSDTEVLLEAISAWGARRALQECVGMFSLGLWDRKAKALTLARDRIGEKPLYYGWLGQTLAFASELKALRQHPDWCQEIDRDSLALLMRYAYVPAPYSIFKGIHKLRPGCLLTVHQGRREIAIEKYWSSFEAIEAAQANKFEGSREEAADELERLLRQSLSGQMIADVPLGAFLSGGIDSSTIVAVMQSLSSRPTQTFSIGFDVPGYNEAVEAKAVAEHLGTNHTELYVTQRDALNAIPQLPEVYSEPFADASQIPTYLVSKLARSKVTVSLSGDAGDELFSGYTRYTLTDTMWRRLSSAPTWMREGASRLLRAFSPGAYNAAAGALLRFAPANLRYRSVGDKIHKAAHLLTLREPDQLYLQLCSTWSTPTELVLGAVEPPTMLTGLDPVPRLSGAVEEMMYLDVMSYLPDDILTKVDRAAMSVGLETRVPLLDHRIVQFAFSLPLSTLHADGKTKWPLRRVLSRYVPKALIDRPKSGFDPPIDVWLRTTLREWAEDLLDQQSLHREGFFNADLVRKVWNEHLAGRRNHQHALWNVLMFQAWLRSA